jgi:hypothetical protein
MQGEQISAEAFWAREIGCVLMCAPEGCSIDIASILRGSLVRVLWKYPDQVLLLLLMRKMYVMECHGLFPGTIPLQALTYRKAIERRIRNSNQIEFWK